MRMLYHKLKNKRELNVPRKEKKCCSHYRRQRKVQLYSIIFFLLLIKILAINFLQSCVSVCGVITHYLIVIINKEAIEKSN